MQILETGAERKASSARTGAVTPRWAFAGGFSLIELLITVFVIVLLTSIVSLNVGGGGRDLERDETARHFVSLMAYVQSEAEMSGADHGLYLLQDRTGTPHYEAHWLRRYDQGWAEPRGSEELLRPVVLDGDIELWLSLSTDSDVEIVEGDPELRPSPQVVFFASGEVTEGELDWMARDSGDLLYRIRWDLFGRTELLPRGQEPDDP